MRTNVARRLDIRTHEGAKAHPASLQPENALRRSVMSCLLWEREFYEDGQSVADRLAANAKAVPAHTLAAIARGARSKMHLRHTPLLLLSILAETHDGSGVADAIADVVQRADEPGELLSLHAKRTGKEVKKAMTNAMRKGLARAVARFDAYQLAKYDRDSEIKLRDVIRLVHPKPRDAKHGALLKAAIDRTLPAPDTWEVALSGGADKREAWTRLLKEGKLGYLALLRNLRNMEQAGVEPALVEAAILARKGAHNVLPFRYIAAARAAPRYEPALDKALLAAIEDLPKLAGQTLVLVDVSGSMGASLSQRSDMTRMDAAAALASVVNAESLRVFTFSHQLVEVPPRRGMAGVDAVIRSQPHGGTYLGQAVGVLNGIPHDRLIVVTDEQSADRVPDPVAPLAYMINVASYQNGVGYGRWCHIDGWSENVLRFIAECERAA